MATLPAFIGTLDNINAKTYAKFITWTLGFTGTQSIRTSPQEKVLSQVLKESFPTTTVTEDSKLDQIRDENAALEVIEKVSKAGEICILPQAAFEFVVQKFTNRRRTDELLVEGTKQFQVVKVRKELERYCGLFHLDIAPAHPSQHFHSFSASSFPIRQNPVHIEEIAARAKPAIDRLFEGLPLPNPRFPAVQTLTQANADGATVLTKLRESKNAMERVSNVENLRREIAMMKTQIGQLQEYVERQLSLTMQFWQARKVHLSERPQTTYSCVAFAVNFSQETIPDCFFRVTYAVEDIQELPQPYEIQPGGMMLEYSDGDGFARSDHIEVVLVQNGEEVSNVLAVDFR